LAAVTGTVACGVPGTVGGVVLHGRVDAHDTWKLEQPAPAVASKTTSWKVWPGPVVYVPAIDAPELPESPR